MKSIFTNVLMVSFLLVGCGRQVTSGGGAPSTPPPTDPVKAKFTLVLFGAPWCTNCKSEFPKINEGLKGELTKPSALIQGSLLVTSNATPSEKPTQEAADTYRNFLKMDFSAAPDEWRCKKYKQWVKLTSCAIPAGVLLDDKENVVLTFEPGATTFNSERVISEVKAKLQ